MKEIKGICPILAAPFTQDGEVDLESLKKLTAALIEQGCHGVTLFGIAGEYYKLSDAERQAMAEAVVEVCRQKDGTSILSVTDHATEKAVQTAQRYEALGADCLMLLPPFFLKPGASYVYTHMKAVAQSVDLPIMVQYAPEQTGVTIPPDMLKRLGEECPNVKYYKIECKPPGLYITQMMKLTEGKAKIFVGNAGFQLIEAMDRGAIGAMPGCSMADVYLNIYREYTAGNRCKAIKLHSELLPMLNHIRQNVEQIISFEKRILKRRGMIATDYCRRPSYDSDPYFDRLFEEFYGQMAERYQW